MQGAGHKVRGARRRVQRQGNKAQGAKRKVRAGCKDTRFRAVEHRAVRHRAVGCRVQGCGVQFTGYRGGQWVPLQSLMHT